MSATYVLIYHSPSFAAPKIFKTFTNLDIARADKTVGALTVTIPTYYMDIPLQPDAIIEVQRQTETKKYIWGETCYILQDWENGHDSDGRPYVTLECDDSMSMGGRRIVDYYAGSAYASKTTYLDNMQKAVVEENYTTFAVDPDRRLATTVLSLEGNKTGAPSASKAFSHKNVHDTLVEIADQSEQLGTYLTWDWVWTGSQWNFRTYTDQRGTNLGLQSGTPMYVSMDRGNLVNPKMRTIYRETASHIIAGGKGEEADRIIQRAQSLPLEAISAIGRKEVFVDARNAETPAEVLAEANAELNKRRPRVHFTGELKETNNCRLDEHFGFGSIVAVEYNGQKFDCRVSTINISVDGDGNETLSIPLEGENVLL
jgi:hypothetical protein